MTALTVGSMFTGIGGIDLGLERAGMRVIWQAEIDEYASRVLAKHWPDVPNLGDVTTIEWGNVERPDLICGGYPCQPFSTAGQRQGENDPRHLWPRMHDAIRILRPRWVLLENVAAHLSLGFGRVLADLASLGYDAEWDCVPASAVGAPHRRDRIFVVAYPSRTRRREDTRSAPGDEGPDEGRSAFDDHVVDGDGESGRTRHVADANSGRREVIAERHPAQQPQRRSGPLPEWTTPTRNDWWEVEPDVGRVANGPADELDRVARLRALGNAVVPQVAEHLGRLIVAADQPSESTLHNPNNT